METREPYYGTRQPNRSNRRRWSSLHDWDLELSRESEPQACLPNYLRLSRRETEQRSLRDKGVGDRRPGSETQGRRQSLETSRLVRSAKNSRSIHLDTPSLPGRRYRDAAPL